MRLILIRFFIQIYIYLQKINFIKKINNNLLGLTLLARGYHTCGRFAEKLLFNKNDSCLYKGEVIFIQKFDLLNIKNCIDIGANVGEFSSQILKNKNTKVVAFEPLPFCIPKLKQVEKKFPNRLKIFNCALSNENKDKFIYHTNNIEDSGISTLETCTHEIDYVRLNNKNKTSVKTTTLDQISVSENIKDIDFIKIDVEGHEIKVLLGAKDFLKQSNVKIIQLEFNLFHMMTKNSIFEFSKILENYKVTQLNLVNGKLLLVDPQNAYSNIFILSNFIFIKKDFFENYKKLLF